MQSVREILTLPRLLVWSQEGCKPSCLVQAEALNQPGVLSGRNLVFTAPTSAGKSAVAEILMLRRLCEFKDKVCRTSPRVLT